MLPEDRFHLRLPSGVDQYTGMKYDDDEERDQPIEATTEFPEDRCVVWLQH